MIGPMNDTAVQFRHANSSGRAILDCIHGRELLEQLQRRRCVGSNLFERSVERRPVAVRVSLLSESAAAVPQ